MHDVEQKLNNEDFFECKRGRCRLRYKICIERQRLHEEQPYHEAYIICGKCPQGNQNKESLCEKCHTKPKFTKFHNLCRECLEKNVKEQNIRGVVHGRHRLLRKIPEDEIKSSFDIYTHRFYPHHKAIIITLTDTPDIWESLWKLPITERTSLGNQAIHKIEMLLNQLIQEKDEKTRIIKLHG